MVDTVTPVAKTRFACTIAVTISLAVVESDISSKVGGTLDPYTVSTSDCSDENFLGGILFPTFLAS